MRTKLGFASVAVLLMAGLANAAIQTGDVVSIDRSSGNNAADGDIDVYSLGNSIDTYGSGPGGEFRITNPSGAGGAAVEQFQTFCIERNEYISVLPPGNYYVTINDRALRGGVGVGATYAGDVAGTTAPSSYVSPYVYSGVSVSSGDPISEATKWLYNAYLNNQLDGAVAGYQYDSDSSANALQDAFWFLENELSSLSAGSLAKKIADAAISAVSAAGYVRVGYDVLALNLWANKSGNNYSGLQQTQLYWVGTSGSEAVPEPASVLVWGGLAAIGCAVYVCRRRT